MGSLLPLAVVIPIAAASAVPLLSRLSGRLATAFAVVALAATTGLLVAFAPRVYGGRDVTHYLGGWGPVRGTVLGVTLTADAWGLTFALASAGIGTLILAFLGSEQAGLGRKERGGLTALCLLLVAALVGGALTADLLNLFVWFEVAALASYSMTGFFLERPPALEAAFKILAMTAVAGFLVFVAVALLYSGHGALNLGQVHDALARRVTTADRIAFALLIAGFATKAGLVPFHGWLADAHTAAPGPVSALFSGLMVAFGMMAVGRIVFDVYAPANGTAQAVLTVLGTVSALGGAAFALLQDDLKRLLAYDTISQMGVLAVGLGTASATGLAGTAYHAINHALFKSLLFLCAGAVVHGTGATKLSEMGGIARRMPWLAAAFTVGVAAIAGLPPLNGYVSLGLIHEAIWERRDVTVYAAMLVAQVLTVAALGRCVVAMFRPASGEFDRDERLRPGMFAALVGLGGGCVASGVLAAPLLAHVAGPAAAALLDPAGYAHAALSGGGVIAPVTVAFDWLNPAELVEVPLTVVLAVLVARTVARVAGSGPVRRLRAVQSGSVNDYLAYLCLGLAALVATIAAA